MSVRILTGDVRERLAELPDASIQCCVTSPPYFGLRDYGTAAWDGGDPDCDHKNGPLASPASTLAGYTGDHVKLATGGMPYRGTCRKCGAVRQDRQIGLEATLAEYVQTMVEVFREVRRVLRDDGVLWLNLGDSYAGSGKGPTGENGIGQHETRQGFHTPTQSLSGFKPKDLMMVPARVALALQDDGWYLRSDTIWHKPNPMPESVTDRPTSAHEHIFLLTKRSRYYYDAYAIREASIDAASYRPRTPRSADKREGDPLFATKVGNHAEGKIYAERNARNVWTMATTPYKEAHFATFPPELPRRCILAGTSEKGACSACGAPWVRHVEQTGEIRRRWSANDTASERDNWRKDNGRDTQAVYATTGWRASCECDAEAVPCVVLDPFAGAGTALLVADQLGRDAVGIELKPKYAALIERRLKEDAPMFVELEAVPMPMQAVLL
jgi:DNA modification methylase